MEHTLGKKRVVPSSSPGPSQSVSAAITLIDAGGGYPQIGLPQHLGPTSTRPLSQLMPGLHQGTVSLWEMQLIVYWPDQRILAAEENRHGSQIREKLFLLLAQA